MTVHEFPRDHGSLANLDKDHHPQYLLKDSGAYLVRSEVKSHHDTANETLTGDTYQDLTASVADVEVGSSGVLIVHFAAWFRARGTGNQVWVSPRMSGATTVTAKDHRAIMNRSSEELRRFGTTETYVGLTAGLHTITLQARTDTTDGDAHVLNRSITAIPA